ncbi:MAG: 50S ribosome-binding GTPase [Lachnospiraceae bacterium]|nr:50S ribosome-binding GTPase [Lachnospiraceae bacterium]
MAIKIALAGNPNCGKTTLFNALTGSNQYVGNWPGVTVEKKGGKLKGQKDVEIMDLPGIYSLSPYTLEEVVARNYIISEHPDAIINIVDGTNIERNLYLSTQVIELGIPVVVAINMMDLVEKSGDKINTKALSKSLGCEVVEISAMKGTGIDELSKKAVAAANSGKAVTRVHKFADEVEDAIEKVEEKLGGSVADAQKRFFAIKLLEKDTKIAEQMKSAPDVSAEIKALEDAFDDDTESIITSERYAYISSIIDKCVKKVAAKEKLTTSDKIDRIVTNRILALPIFALVMFLVYYIAMSTIGAAATDWTNDNLFDDGFHLFGVGTSDWEEADEEYAGAAEVVSAFVDYAAEQGEDVDAIAEALDEESEEYDADAAASALTELVAMIEEGTEISYTVEDEETLETLDAEASYDDLVAAAEVYETYSYTAPEMGDYGIYIPSIPMLFESALNALNCADWLSGLVLDGIVAGIGAVLGFVPQMLVLFILLAFLEYCGYMARIAFILDRIFRRFGLSGKSFIPMLVSMGCGVPGVMASRTIENEKDRRMTIMTTTFIPCGAKVPFIAMVAGALLGGNPLIATAAYFIGVAAVICSGIILKKTKMFSGDPAPFVMELPAYHWPKVSAVLRSMWERGWSFIKKAGTIILLSTIVIWFATYFGFTEDGFRMLAEDEIDSSILAAIGGAIAWIFIPQGWGNWQAAVASITGLVAKENIVGTMGILYANGDGTVWQNMQAAFVTGGSSVAAGFSFLLFNLLCAPCFAAMGAIKREMNNTKWFWFAIGYQCGFAYLVSLVVYQFAGLATGECGFGIFTIVAIAIVVLFVYMLFRPDPYKNTGKAGATARA